jgi:hypothetical protein
MKADVLAIEQVDALRTLQGIWGEHKIVVIGATALGFFIDMR